MGFRDAVRYNNVLTEFGENRPTATIFEIKEITRNAWCTQKPIYLFFEQKIILKCTSAITFCHVYIFIMIMTSYNLVLVLEELTRLKALMTGEDNMNIICRENHKFQTQEWSRNFQTKILGRII